MGLPRTRVRREVAGGEEAVALEAFAIRARRGRDRRVGVVAQLGQRAIGLAEDIAWLEDRRGRRRGAAGSSNGTERSRMAWHDQRRRNPSAA
jgi:hypothetical protein